MEEHIYYRPAWTCGRYNKDKAVAIYYNLIEGFSYFFEEYSAVVIGFILSIKRNNSFTLDEISEKTGFAKENLLDFLNLTDRKDHKPSMLSGGEQQRIAVARALINDPSIVLADEPSGNLDSQSAKELHELFFNLRKKTGQTFVIVTHNPQLAEMADRTFSMKDGMIIFDKKR